MFTFGCTSFRLFAVDEEADVIEAVGPPLPRELDASPCPDAGADPCPDTCADPSPCPCIVSLVRLSVEFDWDLGRTEERVANRSRFSPDRKKIER